MQNTHHLHLLFHRAFMGFPLRDIALGYKPHSLNSIRQMEAVCRNDHKIDRSSQLDPKSRQI